MTLAALAAMLWSLPAAAQEEYRQPALENPESWSVVVIPDLQGYAKNEASQPIARLMTAWIADNIERLNVRMVLCVGDVVEQNDRIGNGFSGDLTSVRQWQGMADAFDVLDGRVPYLVATGNHDYTYTRSGARRTHLNEYFPIGRNPLNAAAICQFGLDSDENPAVENCAFELKAPDGKDYLFLNMEFAPRDTVMKWAQQVAGLEEYADHRIVLMTHAYLDAKDQRLSGPCKVTSYEPLVRNGRKVDEVQSYTAMRKFSIGRDENDIVRLELNNEPLFQFGPLDQGWWPDGLYTAPSDEALAFDVIKTKELGYNMIRKHVKVEPARWYYHCDKLGMIVWQDMPNGDQGPQWQMHNYFNGAEKHRSAESEANFRKEWKEIIDCLYSVPSIGVWVPFNEAWGQFKAPEIAEWTKAYDPSRLVNPASGGNHYLTGDILDTHHYPHPRMTLLDTNRATVLGEYGGIGLPMEGHLWWNKRNWGYVQFKTPEEVTAEYEKYAKSLIKYVRLGFSGAVYTQTTDVEGEVNGLFTYDRKVMKVLPERLKAANKAVIESMPLDME